MDLVILDVNETLFSLDPVATRMAEVGLDGRLEVWFTRVLRDGFAAAASHTFAEFADLAHGHLVAMLPPGSADAADHVIEGFRHVAPHDDVAPGLRRLADAGIRVVTMTNGSVDIARSFLERHGLDGLVEALHDVSSAQAWKPAPEAYAYACAVHEVEPGRAALVAVHPWDVHGAVAAGLTGVWVDRDGGHYPAAFHPPTVSATSFDSAIAACLGLDA